ncbi:MAG: hypothetical protein A3C02_04315 [Candidatus Andersenbacteria bacterium RIFCSPHIGHO2_02_FULL_45_11]|uniref:DUF5666 domain-containing protein n=1 Tax=Candidatus Andersenbacteria bacterium RIFCSPHIGHO2_12_FULL_45_11 TaxID=1797281 RepID=A0A1G1X0W8_9BACT|nr:MAG: hypothetical protein A3C02_04315 [Candidatus Andersenbacteria bacterium RIFCSPHIGHO2_02_FULL_45_11]OGY33441.1 MAG: hypothetical protein A3D99_04845 [Candidatus Andersenbacteria bacterium RIFCSPHIGHO2_12_FULL_45_11]
MKAYNILSVFALALALSLGLTQSADAATWAFKGVVTEVNQDRIEMMGTDSRGVATWHKFRITHNTWLKNGVLLFDVSEEMRHEARNEIQRGSVVTVWYTAGHEAMVIQNMSPWGLGEAYGPGECSHCGK